MSDKAPATEQEPLKDILERLRGNADEYSMTRWKGGGPYNTVSVNPPDILAVTDQIKAIESLAKDTKLPMQLLWGIATILSESHKPQEQVTGNTLLACHHEIAELTKFATDLATMEVDYPLQDKDPEDDKDQNETE